MTLVFAPLLIVVSVWLYTLVFAFSALWFAHYSLAALAAMRGQAAADEVRAAARPGTATGDVVDAIPILPAPGAPPASPLSALPPPIP